MSKDTSMTSKFINRGEQIEHSSELGRFEAQCFWNWKDDEPTYPVEVEINSIKKWGFVASLFPISRNKKLEIARRIKQELEEKTGRDTIVLFERTRGGTNVIS
jgi:hypothetical protein